MAENKHSLNFDNGIVTVRGVKQVVEIEEKQAVFKLEGTTLTVKGTGLNVVKLDREQGVVILETGSVTSFGYHSSGMSLKGLFR